MAVGLGWTVDAVHAAEPTILEGHTNVVSSLRFTADGKQLLSGGWDRTVRVWDVESAKAIGTVTGYQDWVFALAISGDYRLAASQRSVRRFAAGRQAAAPIGGQLGGAAINCMAFSLDGSLLACGRRDGAVHVWKVGGAEPETIWTGFDSWVSCLAVAPNNQFLIAATRGGAVRRFDLASGKEVPELVPRSGRQLLAAAINPAGDTLAFGGADAQVYLWDLKTGKQSAKLAGHRGMITALAWSRDGRRLASGERHGPIKLWDAGGGTLLATLAGHGDKKLGFSVTALAFCPTRPLLASGGYDKRVKLWTVPK